jgi:hypothetical protein
VLRHSKSAAWQTAPPTQNRLKIRQSEIDPDSGFDQSSHALAEAWLQAHAAQLRVVMRQDRAESMLFI